MTDYSTEGILQEAKYRARPINEAILSERMRVYDAIQGPCVGDWVDTPKGQFRIAHHCAGISLPHCLAMRLQSGQSNSFVISVTVSDIIKAQTINNGKENDFMSETEKIIVALWRKGRTSQDIAAETGIPMRLIRAILDELTAVL